MELQTAAQIIERIDQAVRSHPGGVVATDGDGTLWAGDVGEDFFHAVLAQGGIREEARAAMARDAAEHGLSDAGTGDALAQRLYAEYLAGRFPEDRICELMTWICAGWLKREVDAYAASILSKLGLEARLHKEVHTVLAWAKSKGIEVFLVSASPCAIIEHAGRFLGIDDDHMVAALPRYDAADRMLPDVFRPIPYAAGKVRNLRARIGQTRPIYAAFGDNAFDIAMLSEAFIPVAVRPKPRLRERSAEVKMLVEIERES
jgi:phosphoserine phosphatase